jgi:hypothetical protein
MKEWGSGEAIQPRQVEGLLDKMSAIERVSIYNGEVEGAEQGAGRRGEERGGWKLSVMGAERKLNISVSHAPTRFSLFSFSPFRRRLIT